MENLVRLGVCISPTTRAHLERAAREEGMSVSHYARRALDRYVFALQELADEDAAQAQAQAA